MIGSSKATGLMSYESDYGGFKSLTQQDPSSVIKSGESNEKTFRKSKSIVGKAGLLPNGVMSG